MALNYRYGPPCFCLEHDGRFCGRAQQWDGHDDSAGHKFVSLADLLKQCAQLEIARQESEKVECPLNERSCTAANASEIERMVQLTPVAWHTDQGVVMRSDVMDLLNWHGSWAGMDRAIPDSWQPFLYS